MKPPPSAAAQSRAERAAAWALLAGNFAMAVGVMAVPGALNDIARDLSVTAAAAGQLITIGGWAMALAGPLLATLLTGMDRRTLLAASLLWFAVGHALALALDSLALLLPLRALTVLAAVVFTPQAAALVTAISAPEQRGRAITFVFLGWSLASVLGMPLAAQLSEVLGWRSTFAAVTLLSTGAALAIWRHAPAGLRVQGVGRDSWGAVWRHPLLLPIVLVTALSASGQFTVFAYMAPYYRQVLGTSAEGMSLLFLWFGLFGLLGSVALSRHVDRLGAATAATLTLGLMTLALLTWPLATGTAGMALVLVPWALGCFAGNSAQQARLAGTVPALTAVLVALNSSAMYLGQGIGAGLGGALLAVSGYRWLSWAGAAMMLTATLLSAWLARRARAHGHD